MSEVRECLAMSEVRECLADLDWVLGSLCTSTALHGGIRWRACSACERRLLVDAEQDLPPPATTQTSGAFGRTSKLDFGGFLYGGRLVAVVHLTTAAELTAELV